MKERKVEMKLLLRLQLYRLLSLLMLLLPVSAFAAPFTPPRYTLTVLPGVGRAINNLGTVAGTLLGDDGKRHAYILKNGKVRMLTEFAAHESEAFGINDLGEVVGTALIITDGTNSAYLGPFGAHLPTLWNGTGLHFYFLPHSDGDFGAAYALNNQHEIVGYAFDGGVNGFVPRQFEPAVGDFRGYIYPALLGKAFAINDQGLIAGYLQDKFDPLAPPQATYWENGVPHYLAAPSLLPSVAYGVSEKGQFVGQIGEHAALWAGTQAIPSVSSVAMSAGYDINDAGIVVGEGHGLAFLFAGSEAFRLAPLVQNGAGWNLTRAWAINNDGWIAGEGTYQGKTLGFLLTPLPSSGRYVPPSGGR
jgi:uncharacterized membrane protein